MVADLKPLKPSSKAEDYVRSRRQAIVVGRASGVNTCNDLEELTEQESFKVLVGAELSSVRPCDDCTEQEAKLWCKSCYVSLCPSCDGHAHQNGSRKQKHKRILYGWRDSSLLLTPICERLLGPSKDVETPTRVISITAVKCVGENTRSEDIHWARSPLVKNARVLSGHQGMLVKEADGALRSIFEFDNSELDISVVEAKETISKKKKKGGRSVSSSQKRSENADLEETIKVNHDASCVKDLIAGATAAPLAPFIWDGRRQSSPSGSKGMTSAICAVGKIPISSLRLALQTSEARHPSTPTSHSQGIPETSLFLASTHTLGAPANPCSSTLDSSVVSSVSLEPPPCITSSSLSAKSKSFPVLPSINGTDTCEADMSPVPLFRSVSLPIGMQHNKLKEKWNGGIVNQLPSPSSSESGSSSTSISPGSAHPFLSRSSSCPVGRPSSLRGGKPRPSDLRVKWAPEVWDPPPSSSSHTVGSLSSLQRSGRGRRNQSSMGHSKRKSGDGGKLRRGNKGATGGSKGSNNAGGGSGKGAGVAGVKGSATPMPPAPEMAVGSKEGGGEASGKGVLMVDDVKVLVGTSEVKQNSNLAVKGAGQLESAVSEDPLNNGTDGGMDLNAEGEEWTVVAKKGARGGGRSSSARGNSEHERGEKLLRSQIDYTLTVQGDHTTIKDAYSCSSGVCAGGKLLLQSGSCSFDNMQSEQHSMSWSELDRQRTRASSC